METGQGYVKPTGYFTETLPGTVYQLDATDSPENDWLVFQSSPATLLYLSGPKKLLEEVACILLKHRAAARSSTNLTPCQVETLVRHLVAEKVIDPRINFRFSTSIKKFFADCNNLSKPGTSLATAPSSWKVGLLGPAGLVNSLSALTGNKPDSPLENAVSFVSTDYWSDMQLLDCDFVIVLEHSDFFDRGITANLSVNNMPHLVVQIAENTVRIGPTCQPKVSACIACLDHAIAEYDPAYGRRILNRNGFPRPHISEFTLGLIEKLVERELNLLINFRSTSYLNKMLTISIPEMNLVTTRINQHPKCICSNKSVVGSGQAKAAVWPNHDLVNGDY